MVYHSANFCKVKFKACHGSYDLELFAQSPECNVENLLVNILDNHLPGRPRKIPNLAFEFDTRRVGNFSKWVELH
jgi:hypothetical protein